MSEARAVADAGCDLVTAQGIEAGGHIRGSAPLFVLLSEVLQAVDVPVLAAGGISDSPALATVMAAGAAGAVWVYQHTGGSVLSAILMHASLAGSSIMLFPPLSVAANTVGGFTFAAALWAMIGIIALTHSGQLPTNPTAPRGN